jgi:UPF0716 protein FxsA
MLPLFLLFTLVPALELYLIVTIGARIGILNTIFVIIATGVLGMALARNEGMMVLERIRSAAARGEMPQDSIVDGLLILVAGALLVTPGFFTDILGLLALFPLTRPLLRRPILKRLKAHMVKTYQAQQGHPGQAPGQAAWPFEDKSKAWPPNAQSPQARPKPEVHVQIDAIEKPPGEGERQSSEKKES